MQKVQNEALRRLDAQLDEIARLAERRETELSLVREKVSAWSPAHHLDHALKVSKAVLGAVLEPKEPLKAGINMAGRFVLLLGRFPRGRGKSPKALRGEGVDSRLILESLETVRALRASLSPSLLADPTAIVKHPYFGGFHAAQALRFLTIHTQHHLRIISDILKPR